MNKRRLFRTKIVLLGAPGVGKTSLVRRYVDNVFRDDYLTTLGVKVDRKRVHLDEADVALLIWDMHGETDGLEVPNSYLRGVSVGVAVFDSSRPPTIGKAVELAERLQVASPNARVYFAANKSDLDIDWEALAAEAKSSGIDTFDRLSARQGSGVEALFESIAATAVGS